MPKKKNKNGLELIFITMYMCHYWHPDMRSINYKEKQKLFSG